MNATGTSVGRSYLGVPRMHPIAGTDRSLGKLLRRELADLYGDSWWDGDLHPWVFCAFDKTLTALCRGASIPPVLVDSEGEREEEEEGKPRPVLRYQWRGIIPAEGPDPRFHLLIPDHQAGAVAQGARAVRFHHGRSFVERELGFFGARSLNDPHLASGRDTTVVLDGICLRARAAHDASRSVRRDLALCRDRARRHRNRCDRPKAVQAEARARRLEELELALQLWTDQMLDLAYWMQRNEAVRKRGYTDGHDLARSANFLLYPHGRRFVSLYDAPDLVPWLPYTSACQERNYWSPPGGAGGLTVSAGAEPRTSTSAASSSSSSRSSATASSSSSSSSASSSAAANQGMAALAHMVLSKSNPHPCKVRNLDQIAVRNALEDPPVGLAAMDMVHIMMMGNYPGCRYRPHFAVRARIRTHSLVFRGATASETTQWMRTHYRLLHLAFKEWYAQTVRWSPAYEAVIADVQHHTEYVAYGRRAADELRGMLAAYGRCTHNSVARVLRQHGYQEDFIGMPPPGALDDAAHMSHGASLRTFGKLRKGSFVVTICDRMRGWLRALCTGKENMAQQYKEELTQMMVLSKILYSQPEYGARVVEDIQAAARAEAATKDPSEAAWRHTPEHDPIERWALGAPLASLPTALIESFLKWEGDSALTVSPWFADRSFFLSQPYPFLGDADTLRAIDLAAWMCARRTDGRFVMSWLRYPIGLSAQAYQRLQTLYFSYECCDVADNSFLVQLRRFLFRRRRRVIPAQEYDARMAAGDASIVQGLTEPIKRVQRGQPGPPVPVAYRVVEEYGTPESRRDFAILYEYVNRVVAYSTWSVVPLPRRVMAHQIEAVRRRQTIEPWRRTDADLLGSRHLCPCGRWCCQVVTPPLRSITSSVTERRRSSASGTDSARLIAQIEEEAERRIQELWRETEAQLAEIAWPEQPTDQGDGAQAAYDGKMRTARQRQLRIRDGFEERHAALLSSTTTAIRRVESEQPVLYNVVPTRRSARPVSTAAMEGGGDSCITISGAGAVSALDDRDVRLSVCSARWGDPDWILRRDADRPPPASGKAKAKRKSSSSAASSSSSSAPTTTQAVLPSLAEPVTRDVHPSARSCVIGGAYVTCDLSYDGDEDGGGGGRLVSKEPNRAPYCRGQLFRINLLGQAVRPKGPKAPTDGPWYTLCATCGCLTTLDMGRWDHRGPTCGAHGRPHRLPERISPYDPRIEGRAVALRASVRALAVSAVPAEPVHRNGTRPQPAGPQDAAVRCATAVPPTPQTPLAERLRGDLSLLDAQAGLPCPDEIPCCWYCHMPTDRRQSTSSRAVVTASAVAAQESADAAMVEEQTKDGGGGDPARARPAAPPPMSVRYAVGTSVATATIGCAGAALYARRKTIMGTHQADPVRRINVRGSMFGHLGGPRGGSLLVPAPPGRHDRPHTHRCSTNACDCPERIARAGDAGTLRQFEELGRARRRHAVTLEARVLPAEMLPVVGEEMTLKVLDDVNPRMAMRQRWIYLCPLHMKDLRVGWIALRGRIVQNEAEARAAEAMKEVGGDAQRLADATLARAASGTRIGRRAMVQHMFGRVPLLSSVLRALRRGHQTRVRQTTRFGGGAKGARTIPDYGDRRKKRDG